MKKQNLRFLGKFCLITLVLALSLVLVGQASAGPIPEDGNLKFAVYLSGNQIGSDTFTFNQKTDTRLIVNRSVTMRINFYYIYDYYYKHEVRSVWSNGSVKRFQANTNYDGSIVQVEVNKTDDLTNVNAPDTSYKTNVVWLPTTWWNPVFLEKDRLINAQTGKLERIDTSFIGQDKLNFHSETYEADHHRVSGDIELDLWFDRSDQLVKLEYDYQGRHFVHRRID